MIGRNELCPCGSGKKYKKCCLQKNQVIEFAKNKTLYAKGLYNNLENKINDYSKQERFSEDRNECKQYFYVSHEDNAKINKLFNTYFVHDFTLKNNKVIANMFVEENQSTLSKMHKAILMGMLKSNISIFKVEDISSTKSSVRDYFNDIKIVVEDIDSFKNLQVGDNIIARPVNMQGMNILVDDYIKLSQENVDLIINNIRNIYITNEKNIKNIKEFLVYNSELIYKFAQQIIINDKSYRVKPQELNYEGKKDFKVQKNDELDIYNILKDNIEEKYLQKGINLWKEFIKANNSVKGSENGWAAAVEYYIKKDAGEIVTQAQVSQKYEISPRTLGKRYKELKAS